MINQPIGANLAQFSKTLHEANALLDQGKLEEALSAAKAAARLDTNRFEAPFLAAVIHLELKQPEPARLALNTALALAPANKKAQLEALTQELDVLDKAQPPTPIAASEPLKFAGAARRQFDALMLIIEDADKAKTEPERKQALREFLDKSEPFVKDHPDEMPLWTLRAVAALELNRAKSGWEAGKQLARLSGNESEDVRMRKVMAMLERKGWMGAVPPQTDEKEPPIAPPATESMALKNTELLKAIAPFVGDYQQGGTQIISIRPDGAVAYTSRIGWFGASVKKVGEGRIRNYDSTRRVIEIDWTPTSYADWEIKKLLAGRNGDATVIDGDTLLFWKRWKHSKVH